MTRTIFILLITTISISTKAQTPKSRNVVRKTGWLVYFEESLIWIEAPLSKTVKYDDFFRDTLYKNGLRITNYKAMYYGLFAHEFPNEYYKYYTDGREINDSATRFFRLLPVVARIKFNGTELGLKEEEIEWHFLTGSKGVTVLNKFERNYSFEGFECFAKKDRIKAARYFATLKPPIDKWYGQKDAY